MTSAEYQSSFAKARRQWLFLTSKAMKSIHAAYAEAGSKIADIIREGELVDGDLSFETQQAVDRAILEGSQAIGEALRNSVPAMVYEAAGLYAVIESTFLTGALGDAGMLTAEGIAKLFTKTSESSVLRSLNTVGADGRIFWGRVPNVSKYFGDDVVGMVRASISQGRDLGKIAADVNKYIRDGKTGTIHRWGDIIEPDSARLLKRVPEKVDYRALRLARSELTRGLQATAKENGRANPGTTGWYEWIRINAIDWGCVCNANAENGPYEYDNVPGYPHPNCGCIVRPVLKDGSDFRNELRAWANGESNADLDAWYQSSYLPAQF